MTAFGHTGQALPLFEADDEAPTITRPDRRLRVVPPAPVLNMAPATSAAPAVPWQRLLPWALWMALVLGGFVWQFVDTAAAFVRR